MTDPTPFRPKQEPAPPPEPHPESALGLALTIIRERAPLADTAAILERAAGEAKPRVIQHVVTRTINAALVEFCNGCGGLFFIGHPEITPILGRAPDGSETRGIVCRHCLAEPAEPDKAPLIASPAEFLRRGKR